MWYVHTHIHTHTHTHTHTRSGVLFSHNKGNTFPLAQHLRALRDFKGIMLSEIDGERQIPHDLIYMWSLINTKINRRYKELIGGCQRQSRGEAKWVKEFKRYKLPIIK